MNVVCPECGSIFRVDPAKIPLAGVRARCSVCGGVIAIGERGRIDDDFAAPQPVAAQSATRSAQSAASPAPLPPRPAITMPTPPQPSRAQVDALLSGMSRTAMPNADVSAAAPSAPPKPHVSGAMPAVPASPTAAAAAAAASHASSAPAQPTAPPRTGFPFSHAPSAPAAPGGAPVPRPAPPRMPTPAPSVGHAAPAAPQAPPAGIPFAQRPAAPSAAPPAVPAAPPAAPRATAPVQRPPAAPGSRAPINPFLSNDPNVKAKRLARALVSDIVAYFPDKHREGLRNGTLRELFREEIKKSYEEYVDQMTREFAESTTHFQDALNDVLAGGKRIF